MLVDYCFKTPDLLELLDCMIICHEAKSSLNGKIQSFIGEEKATINLCRQLGLGFEISPAPGKSDFYKTFKLKINGI